MSLRNEQRNKVCRILDDVLANRPTERDALIVAVKAAFSGLERKTGKWIERNPQNSGKCRLIECNKCGFSHIVGFNVPYEHWIENRNFCERCGADMRCEDDDIPIEYFESGGK